MEYYSTNHISAAADLKTAVLKGMPDDKGLYMPDDIPQMPPRFFENIHKLGFHEIATAVVLTLLGEDMPANELIRIVDESLNFVIPLVRLDDKRYILELFHGPTLAFKDVGARFMARLMGYYSKDSGRTLTVLVATSGDTGSAVADAFKGVEGIRVVLLYPSGMVSSLQERQLSTQGSNIHALEVQGSFDDCQRLVKTAFGDTELNEHLQLTSANSINIARLIPQSFYYFFAYARLKAEAVNTVPLIAVPSGNLGNLTAGLIAKRMGLPVKRFIAACNRNDSLTRYLKSGKYEPEATIPTISNAMDVGDPSNFARIRELYGHAVDFLRQDVFSASFDDTATREMMRKIFHSCGYVLDPHGAVGLCALEAYRQQDPETPCICLETAHPAKFYDTVRETLGTAPDIPEMLQEVMKKEKRATLLTAAYAEFRRFLLEKLP
ncbi:MAG: threonine synthase [Candidatus Neomarinimicrobiota bacterium]|nr:threonine synthase [Candidatus Neomarinimicrobiota bacterium]MDD3965824.1 threonine synthase [Candidatus Neomarinimicrobiota bacterium]MDX9779697.1 threonine synthase [bacterium]